VNIRVSGKLLAVALAACVLAGCSTSPMSRIDSNRAAYESWPLEVQQAVLSGRVDKGMTPEMVKVALGEPSKVETRDGKTGEEEVWIYSKGSKAGNLLNNASISTGGSIGGIGVYGPAVPLGGNNASSGEEETDVIFQNGAVTSTHEL
jgi:outer membrane murein-binding lipoprotein Lpp